MKSPAILLAAFMIFPSIAFAQKEPTPVFVTEVRQQQFVDELEALGTLQANENVNLTSSVTERITNINFDSGQRVKKGDLLVEMDAAQEMALMAEEQSIVQEAQKQVERLKPLIERGATSQATMDEAELALQTANSRIAAIQSQIEERRLIAPFDGKLGLRNVSVGVMAQPGTLITTIDDDDVMKLDFSVPEIFLPAIVEGGRVLATARAFPNETFEGVVENIDSRVDTVTRAISVRAILENKEHKLRPGMLMRVKLQNNARQALVIPEEALVPKGNKNYVYILSEEVDTPRATLTAVELGSRRKGEAEIIDGIEEGQKIVTHGTMRLQDGDAVLIKAIDNDHSSLDDMLNQNIQNGG